MMDYWDNYAMGIFYYLLNRKTANMSDGITSFEVIILPKVLGHFKIQICLRHMEFSNKRLVSGKVTFFFNRLIGRGIYQFQCTLVSITNVLVPILNTYDS